MSTGTELHEQMLCGCNRDLMPAKKPKAYPATSKPYYEKTRNPKHPQTQKASLVFLRCKQGVLGPGQLRRPAERPKSKLVMVCPTFASQFQSMTILFTTIIDMQRHCHHRRQSHIQFFSSTMNINTIAAFMIVNLSSTGKQFIRTCRTGITVRTAVPALHGSYLSTLDDTSPWTRHRLDSRRSQRDHWPQCLAPRKSCNRLHKQKDQGSTSHVRLTDKPRTASLARHSLIPRSRGRSGKRRPKAKLQASSCNSNAKVSSTGSTNQLSSLPST